MAMIIQLHEGVAINKFKLDRSPLRIGRDPACDIFIDHTVVSAEHAVIRAESGSESDSGPAFYIEDLKSTNSTFVNGKKIMRHRLKHNDIIRVGWNTFKFIDETRADSNKTAKIRKSWIPGVYYTEEEK